MKRTLPILWIVFILSMLFTSIALADEDPQPLGGCPNSNWELHYIHDPMHADDPMHAEHHAEHLLLDKNGDGFLCVKHPPMGFSAPHLHIDNKY